MSLDSFYAIVSGTCFALVGLWWGVVQFNKNWLKNDETRALAGGVYLSFLIPGVMSLIAQVSGDNKLIWRVTFVVAAALGMYFTTRLILKTRSSASPIGPFRRNRWIVIVLYLLVLIFGAAPELADPLGLKPLQVEAILLAFLILIAHGLTWEFMTQPEEM
jgi:hypothetical protein